MLKKQFIFLKSGVSDSNPDIQNDTDEYLKDLDFESIDFDGMIFFIQSGGTEEIFIQKYKNYQPPYILIATDANNSLASSLEIASFLKSKNLEYYIYHGRADEVREDLILKHTHSIAFNYEFKETNTILKGETLGVIGQPSNWLIASKVDYALAEKKLGVKLIDIPFEEFLDTIEKTRPTGFSSYSKLVNKKISKEELKKAYQIYNALKKLIKKYNLSGLTVRCFNLLGTFHSTSCLALAILNSERITATCEGDVPAMLSMHILNKCFKKPSFQCNPSYLNSTQNFAYLAHCTLPLNMCKSVKLDTHFESGIGVGIVGEMSSSSVTILKLDARLNKFSVYSGKIIENLHRSNLCRSQIKVRFHEPIEQVLTSPCGNHLLLAYGDFASDLVSLLSI
jgi:L-fucose isomerase-like protein